MQRNPQEDIQQITLLVAGRSYRMACASGEEKRLEQLALRYDQRIKELRASVGELGDMRLHVMAALTLADELIEAQEKIQRLEADITRLHIHQNERKTENSQYIQNVNELIEKTAERIEKLAAYLNSTYE